MTTVKELKEILANLDDDTRVIGITQGSKCFDIVGHFFLTDVPYLGKKVLELDIQKAKWLKKED